MQIVIAPTEEHVLGEVTEISTDEDIGQTELSVQNNSDFSADDYVIVGRLGHESAELKQISSVAADLKSITLKTATKHAHEEGEPITKIFYNQRKFYRASSESGTYSHLSGEGSPVDIDVDKMEGTLLEDSTGSSTSWYKATYYNSTTSTETLTTDAIASKAGESDHYTSLYAIRREAGFEDAEGIRDQLISDKREDAENLFESRIATSYSVPLSTKPKLARNIVTKLAAGSLLLKEYGVEANVDISKSGERMIREAENLMDRIVSGDLKLVDDDGSALTATTALEASGSNVYDGSTADKGELFTLEDEHFEAADPSTGKGSTS